MRLPLISLVLLWSASAALATVPMSPQPVLSYRAVGDDRSEHRASYALINRTDTGEFGTTGVTRERASNGLWYQYQASNGFRLDVSLQHIHERLTDDEDSLTLNVPDHARFGTGMTGGIGWTIPLARFGEEDEGWHGAAGIHLGGFGFFSVEGAAFAPFGGNLELSGTGASGSAGLELRRRRLGFLFDVAVLGYVELTPLLATAQTVVPAIGFDDTIDSVEAPGWIRAGVAFQFNWSDDNPTPAILTYSAVVEPVDQQVIGLGIGF